MLGGLNFILGVVETLTIVKQEHIHDRIQALERSH